MNRRNLILKSLSTLYGGQLLDVHLDTMPPYRDTLTRLLGLRRGPGQPFLLQNSQYRTPIGEGEAIPQDLRNADRTVMGAL
ncbi:MAG: hypothetical protein ACOYZ8_04670, partial [Chloroflexota bacterium]